MIEVSELSIEKICAFSSQTQTLVTVDAPLYGSLMVLDGKLLKRKSAVKNHEAEVEAPGIPSTEDIVREASRFWIQDHSGVRDRKNRQEMSELLEQI